MTTRTSTKIPRLRFGGQTRFESTATVVRGATAFAAHRQMETRTLPGIGTYVIDTPKDANLSAREKCFRYQEIHRGVCRSKLKTLPDIPKRHDMKTLPVAKLREMSDSTPRPSREETVGRETQTTPAPSDQGSHEESRSTRRQDTTWKMPSQEELVSRSPIGRIVQTSPETAVVTGFGVRKNKLIPNPDPSRHREFTYLSTNLALSEPEPVVSKATERELESQAEYRKQLTFYLQQMLENERPTVHSDCKEHEGKNTINSNVNNEAKHVCRTSPYDGVGHSSKYLGCESNLRLREMLTNATPELRKKLKLDEVTNWRPTLKENKRKKSKHFYSVDVDLYKSGSYNDINIASGNRGKDNSNSKNINNSNRASHNSELCGTPFHHIDFHTIPTENFIKRSHSFCQAAGSFSSRNKRATVTVPAGSSNKIEIVHHDDDDDEEYSNNDDNDGDDDNSNDKKWTEMVNTKVIESSVYDRYANIKLPPSSKMHPRILETKNSLSSHQSRPNVS